MNFLICSLKRLSCILKCRFPIIFCIAVPDSFGSRFSIAFMTNSYNNGGYLRLFLASTQNITNVNISIPALGKKIQEVIPGTSYNPKNAMKLK